ncbi:glycerol-3-phosphate acyltransferase [Eikenella corrodens]|uniref:Glycerol-3-phosphate acyltransferase n=1 Tax=Eikenella corrodens TaxID=539 RepID=A0A1A9RJF2_EIKCO|nr:MULTISPECIES: glycerol-3-phosphate 1-O-acyltransferase PlsY [Eikenella]MDU4300033.1 glycerol-3-phosphate 1-O-acyltransferase PlsY [Eikenella corrodens]OAM18526.1 glycerol-3-phosphate acyltransferase [Eikenella corrodens]OAM18730.1 glycerol-3-phosphate acyltransferase [Eikenella corrodens]OAM19592.1 glycerol-3-phosphate acyltransferase [Eikenella corrodens]OAM22055.1 glycerol-3-phosphate acyltransferase [Eikenella corrodens]
MWGLAAVVAAYLIGSLSFAVIVSKFYGLDDPRSYGSGNPGATNVLRSGRKKAAALTLLGDALKGLVAVLLARWLQSYFGLADEVVAAVAVAVLAGHMWPLFFGFKGGKGVATALGVLLALSWPVALICAAVWLMMAFGLKISSLAALTATVISPLAAMFLVQQPSWQAAIAVIAALVLLRHRSNIQNLLSGKESKIGSGK